MLVSLRLIFNLKVRSNNGPFAARTEEREALLLVLLGTRDVVVHCQTRVKNFHNLLGASIPLPPFRHRNICSLGTTKANIRGDNLLKSSRSLDMAWSESIRLNSTTTTHSTRPPISWINQALSILNVAVKMFSIIEISKTDYSFNTVTSRTPLYSMFYDNHRRPDTIETKGLCKDQSQSHPITTHSLRQQTHS